jgi:hypothetical protein
MILPTLAIAHLPVILLLFHKGLPDLEHAVVLKQQWQTNQSTDKTKG